MHARRCMMSCRCFKEDLFGICVASESPHVVTIAEMENYCFKETFKHCPIFGTNSLGGTIKMYQRDKTWLRQYLYSEFSQGEGENCIEI
jgi:hypothetical protein